MTRATDHVIVMEHIAPRKEEKVDFEYHPINWHPMGGTNVLDAGDYLLITKSGKPVEFRRTFVGGFVITIDGQRYETDWNTEASAIMNKFEVGGVLKPRIEL